MLLGSHSLSLHVLEPGRQPIDLRLLNIQPAADSSAATGPPGTKPPHLAYQPPTVARWRSGNHLPPAMLRVLHVAGTYGDDLKLGRESPTSCVGQSPTTSAGDAPKRGS